MKTVLVNFPCKGFNTKTKSLMRHINLSDKSYIICLFVAKTKTALWPIANNKKC